MKTDLNKERTNSAKLKKELENLKQNHELTVKEYNQLQSKFGKLMGKGENDKRDEKEVLIGQMECLQHLRDQLDEHKSRAEKEWCLLNETLNKITGEMNEIARTSSDYINTMSNLGNPAVEHKGELNK